MAVNYLRLPDQRAHIPDAIGNLQRSLELAPNFYRSYEALGLVYDALGDKDKAKYYHGRAEGVAVQQK